LAYFKFISMAFQRSLAYRAEYFTGLLNAFLYIFIFTSIWKALLPEDGTVKGLTRNDMVAYAVLSTLIKVSFGRSEYFLGNRVKSGEIAVDLMKPFNLPLMLFCDTVGTSLFHCFARALPMLVFCKLFFQIDFQVDLLILAQFLPVFILSFMLFFFMSFLISTMAFFFVEVFPFWIFYFSLITLASGAIIPLDFFPDVLKNILFFSPFPYLFYFPSMILLQKVNNIFTYSELIFSYCLILVSVISISLITYTAGLKRLSIAGG